MTSNMNTTSLKDKITLEAITALKEKKREEIRAVKENMSSIMSDILEPSESKKGMEGIMQNISTGMAIYDGVQTGMKIIKRVRSFFTKSKSRKK